MNGTVMRMPDWLEQRNVTRPKGLAVSTPSGDLTYRELYAAAVKMAGGLARLGVRGRVGLLAKDSLAVTLAVHAFIQAGLVLVPLNWRLTPRELAWQTADAGIEWVFYDAAESEEAKQIAEILPEVRACALDEIPKNAVPACNHELDLDKVHAVIYTSGTTGHPKGTQITYGNEWWSATGSALQLGVLPTDRWLSPMPMFHVGGLSVLLRSVIYGTTAVLHNGFDAAAINAAIDSGEIALASLVPTMLRRMIELRNGKMYPDTLRAVLLGGSAATRELLTSAKAHRIRVALSYGLTETASQVCTLSTEDVERKLGSSGLPAIMNQVIVVGEQARDENGDPLTHRLPPETPGEILVRGPTVTPGYLNNPEATQSALRKGWLWTGDVGYLDGEGYLFVLDRRRDLIVSGGENIYPAEVESVLESHPAVREVAVVGESSPEWGQIPVAVVVLQDKARTDAEELAQFCRRMMASYKVPKKFHFIKQLPRNASGKLMRRILQEWLERNELGQT